MQLEPVQSCIERTFFEREHPSEKSPIDSEMA
jgi:hypothetical protein